MIDMVFNFCSRNGQLSSIMFIAAGIISCFAGFNFFRSFLAIYGISGGYAGFKYLAFLAGLTPDNTIIAGYAGAVLCMIVFFFFYQAGIFFMGFGSGVLLINLVFKGNPAQVAIAFSGLSAAVLFMLFQKFFIITGTSFLGGFIMMCGGYYLKLGTWPQLNEIITEPHIHFSYGASDLSYLIAGTLISGTAGVFLQYYISGKHIRDISFKRVGDKD